MSERRNSVIQSSHRFHGPCSACGDGDTVMEFHTHNPAPRSYTLPQLSALAREYVEAARERWVEQEVIEAEEHLTFWLAWIQGRRKVAESQRMTQKQGG